MFCLQKTNRRLFLKYLLPLEKKSVTLFSPKLETMPVSACWFEPWTGKVFQFSKIECNLCSAALRWRRERIGMVWLSHNCSVPQTILTHTNSSHFIPFSNRWNTKKPRRVYCSFIHCDLDKCWPTLCSNRDQEPSFLTWKPVS